MVEEFGHGMSAQGRQDLFQRGSDLFGLGGDRGHSQDGELAVIEFKGALPRASFAVIVASPCTSCPASAANGATSGRCKSSVADCCPAVAACARSENSRCVAVSRLASVLTRSWV